MSRKECRDIYGLINTVQYNAQVENASGQVIPPGATIPSGTQITLQCEPHQNDDISWFTPGGAYDSPYGTWETPSSSCTDNYFVLADTIGERQGYIFANFSFASPTQNITNTSRFTSCTTLSDGCSMTCTATNTGTSPVSVPIAFNYSSVRGSFYGSLIPRLIPGVTTESTTSAAEFGRTALNACSTSKFPMSIRAVEQSAYHYLTGNQGNFWAVFWGTSNPVTTVTVPAAQIPYAITIAPASSNTNTNTPPSTTSGSCTSGDCPGTPSITAAANQSCTVNTAYTVSFSASDPQGEQLQYLISWNGDGTVNQIVPASGYVPSGTVETATLHLCDDRLAYHRGTC